MPALVHTLLSTDSFRVTEDMGTVRDAEGLFATTQQKIVYRGSLTGLINKFKVGKVQSSSEGKMLCQGPSNIRLFDGTANDQHWEASVSWVGIHKATHGNNVDFVYRVEDEFARAESEWPKNNRGDSVTVTHFGLGEPYVNNGPFLNGPPGTEATLKRCRVITFLPVKRVIGLMVTNEPVSPANSKLFSLVKTFQAPDDSLIRNWLIQEADRTIDPVWVWAIKYMEGGADGSGAWVPSSLQVRRQLSVGDLKAFTMEVAWELRIQPS